jgi:N-acetylglutamate synthase-like GNAT family acetyltransferase
VTTRILPVAEYAALAGTELETVAPYLPTEAQVVVVEQDGQVVACWALIPVYHTEGLWVHPDHRKRGRVGLRLLEAMRSLTRGLGIRTVATASLSADVDALLQHVGAVELPGKHYVMRMH